MTPPFQRSLRAAAFWRGGVALPAFCLITSAGTGLERCAEAQATYTASRAGDLQVGAGFVFGASHYLTPALGLSFPMPLNGNGESLRGVHAYGTFDFKPHLGAEMTFGQTSPSYGAGVYERTYEIGGRYAYAVGRLRPYGKISYGRGVFNYPQSIANIAYNLSGISAGFDFNLTRSINVRGEYEHQHWFRFPLTPLAPNLAIVGVAYHFAGGGRCVLCVRH